MTVAADPVQFGRGKENARSLGKSESGRQILLSSEEVFKGANDEPKYRGNDD